MELSEAQAIAETKARSKRLQATLPEVMLKGSTGRQAHGRRRRANGQDTEAQDKIEATYNGLRGVWREYLDVARRFDRKVPSQDSLDLRHTIMLAYAEQDSRNERLGKPALSFYGMLRIATHCVADYYRDKAKLTTLLYCRDCSGAKRRECARRSLYSQCPKIKPTLSLDTEYLDAAGVAHTLADTIADDTAIDLDQWLDAHIWLTGCPTRCIEIAHKLRAGLVINGKDRDYLWNFRKKTQKPLF